MDKRLAELYGRYPGWECWVSVTNMLMARRRKSSPPKVVRDLTAEGLATKIEQIEQEIRNR